MLGGFCKSDSYSIYSEIENQFKFLNNVFNEKKFIFKITIEQELKKLLNIDIKKLRINKNKASVHINSDSNLIWTYGINNYTGYGTRWEILNTETKLTYNFGNVIAIFYKNSIIGFEFGGGLEILIQAKLDLENKIIATESFPNFIFKEITLDENFKLIDSFITIFLILDTYGEKEIKKLIRIKYNLFMYYKTIFKIIKNNNFNISFIENYLNLFLNTKHNNKYIKQTKKFWRYFLLFEKCSKISRKQNDN